MKNFDYERPATVNSAIQFVSQHEHAKYLGGGTNLVDLMRENIEAPDYLVDVTHLSKDITELADGSVRVGAAVKNTALATHPLILEKYPVLSQAIVYGASGQIRNMATVAGNIMQRTRCYYFYDEVARCNKRQPGSGCDAIEGFNRIHAILGTSDTCIATHPSDMCVALAALDAKVIVKGINGERQISFKDFHRLPENSPHIETNLQTAELITAIEIPKNSFASHSLYRKVRDRASYAFALVSVAAIINVQDNDIKDIRLALGGVSHKPWRANLAEHFLINKKATEENFKQAAEEELKAAKGFSHNSFKIELAKRTIVNVLNQLTGKVA